MYAKAHSTCVGSPMGKNRLGVVNSRALEGGMSPAVRMVYCARAVEPLLDPKRIRFGLSGAPFRSVPRKHAIIIKGQLPYRPVPEGPLSVRKCFSVKGLVLLMRKHFRPRKPVKL